MNGSLLPTILKLKGKNVLGVGRLDIELLMPYLKVDGFTNKKTFTMNDNIEKLFLIVLFSILILKIGKNNNEVATLKNDVSCLTEIITKQDSINERLKEGIMFSIQLSNYHTDDIINLENSLK